MPYDFKSFMGRERGVQEGSVRFGPGDSLDFCPLCDAALWNEDNGCLPVCGNCLRYQVTPSGLARCQRSSLLVTEGDYCSKFERKEG